MKGIVLLCSVACLVVGCRTAAPIIQTHTVSDTVWVETQTVIRDTVLTAPASRVQSDIAYTKLLNQALNGFEKQFKNARLTVKTIRDTVRITCDCDSIALEAKLRNKIIREMHKTQIKTTEQVPVRYVPKWIKILAWVGGIAVLMLLIGIILKIK